HTRSKRDWSSDVCSSDLGELPDGGAGLDVVIASVHGGADEEVPRTGLLLALGLEHRQELREIEARLGAQVMFFEEAGRLGANPRSEERRVGKKGRCQSA